MPTPTPDTIDALIEQALSLRLEDTRRALQLSQEARQLSLQIDYQKGLAYSLYLNCLCRFILAEPTDLLERSFQVLSLFEGLNDFSGAAKAHNLLALIYERQERFTEALQHQNQSLSIRTTLGDKQGQAASLNNVALVYQAQGQYAPALEYLFQALAVARASGDPRTVAYPLLNIATVYAETGEFTRALDYARQGLAVNRDSNDRALDSSLYTILSQVHRQLGEHQQAIEYLKAGLEISRQTGNLGDEGKALLELGLAYQDLQQYKAAQGALERALQIMQRVSSRLGEAQALSALGRACQQVGDHAAALAYLQRALSAAGAAQPDGKLDEQTAREIHLPLAELYETLGNHHLAIHHWRALFQAWEQGKKGGAGRRVQELTSALEIEKARSETEQERMKITELSEALQALWAANEEKATLLNRLKGQAELLEQLAREDGLTGIANRRWLDLRLGEEFERARRFNHPLTVALLDLDDFKQVNDQFSHQVGDAVLVRVAALLREHFRTVDVVGRYGGEEFMLILIETGQHQALAACERLLQKVGAVDWGAIHPGLVPVTLSMGVVSTDLGGECAISTPGELLASADAQLYRAKRQGKNQVCVCGRKLDPDGADKTEGD